MKTLSMPPRPAILLKIPGSNLQAYAQKHPFLCGPDPQLDAACFRVLKETIELRSTLDTHPLILLERNDLAREGEIAARMRALIEPLDINDKSATSEIDRFAWKMCVLPPTAERVLAFGCGEGFELVALRARFPQASVKAVDFTSGVSADLLERTQAVFESTDFSTWLKARTETFDLIFSNHVVEHLYDPDAVLGQLSSCLNPGGYLVGALPLDADSIFHESLVRLAAAPERIRRGDAFLLNAGHPWKTNVCDLAGTLGRAGFSSVSMYQRSWHPTAYFSGSISEYQRRRKRWRALHAAVVRPLQVVVNALGDTVPHLFLKAVQAFERRLWIGTNNLTSRDAPEVVFVAQKNL